MVRASSCSLASKRSFVGFGKHVEPVGRMRLSRRFGRSRRRPEGELGRLGIVLVMGGGRVLVVGRARAKEFGCH